MRHIIARFGIAAVTLLAVAAGNGSAHASRATIGIEWELDDTGVFGGRPSKPATATSSQLFTTQDLTYLVPETVLCTTARSPINDKLPLVSFTYDMGSSYDRTLEIVTGPLEYDDATGKWEAVLAAVKAYYDAVSAICKPTTVEKPDYYTYDICYASAADVMTKMNELLGPKAIDSACGGTVRGSGNAPGEAGFYLTYDSEGAVHKVSTVRLATANTQVNIGIALSDFGTKHLGRLFSSKGDKATAYTAYQNAFLTMKKAQSPHQDAEVKGFFLLYAYAMNVATEARLGNYDEVTRKNAYDLYLKTPLGEIYDRVRKQITPTASPQISYDEDRISKEYCVVKKEDCEQTVLEWNRQLVTQTGDPLPAGNPINVHKTVSITDDGRVIVEARDTSFGLNQAAHLRWNGAKNALELQSHDEIKKILQILQ